MKKFQVHTYFNEDVVQARLNGQLHRNVHFENQYILFRDLRSSGTLHGVYW